MTYEFTLPLEVETIKACIPHRAPFLFLDRVLELVPGKSLTAVKTILEGDPILAGHFPGDPIFPGVLMIEGLAQASAVLAYYTKGKAAEEILLTEVSKARFRRKVVPNETLTYHISIDRIRGPFGWFSGTASVGDEIAATSQFSALVK